MSTKSLFPVITLMPDPQCLRPTQLCVSLQNKECSAFEVLELMKSVPKHRFKTAFKQFQHINKAYIKAYKIK